MSSVDDRGRRSRTQVRTPVVVNTLAARICTNPIRKQNDKGDENTNILKQDLRSQEAS